MHEFQALRYGRSILSHTKTLGHGHNHDHLQDSPRREATIRGKTGIHRRLFLKQLRVRQVDGPADFKRVSGSSIGGGTYWGLCRLLTGATTYDESLQIASRGDSNQVDMLVGDIYGRGYSKFQLSSNTLASSFGKIGGMESPKGKNSGVGEDDVAKALLVMISLNIGQVR